MNYSAKSGMTAVEVMVSLVIVSIFLFAGFQLYEIISANNLAAQSAAKASNITYGHLRTVSDSLDMSSCSESTITKTLTPTADEKLDGLAITATISAPYGCVNRLMRIEVKTSYLLKGAHREEVQAVYVQK